LVRLRLRPLPPKLRKYRSDMALTRINRLLVQTRTEPGFHGENLPGRRSRPQGKGQHLIWQMVIPTLQDSGRRRVGVTPSLRERPAQTGRSSTPNVRLRVPLRHQTRWLNLNTGWKLLIS